MTILEVVEHGTPDAIEVEIINAVNGVVEKAVAEDWPDLWWTKEILVAVGALGKQHAPCAVNPFVAMSRGLGCPDGRNHEG